MNIVNTLLICLSDFLTDCNYNTWWESQFKYVHELTFVGVYELPACMCWCNLSVY